MYSDLSNIEALPMTQEIPAGDTAHIHNLLIPVKSQRHKPVVSSDNIHISDVDGIMESVDGGNNNNDLSEYMSQSRLVQEFWKLVATKIRVYSALPITIRYVFADHLSKLISAFNATPNLFKVLKIWIFPRFVLFLPDQYTELNSHSNTAKIGIMG